MLEEHGRELPSSGHRVVLDSSARLRMQPSAHRGLERDLLESSGSGVL